ncbi:hypothetical protein [Clostridium sardiniense]|uniref:hypothetical protein n=1 Tax=Clostridium sardiniense TaxID=29369 RepID=UPI003D3445E6
MDYKEYEKDIKYIKNILHMKYLLGIVIGIISITIIASCYNNNEFVQQVSFAGTVSSIILSVIAIIMTINGESESKKNKDTIISLTLELEGIVKDVKKATKNLENAASKEDIKYLKDNIDIKMFEVSRTYQTNMENGTTSNKGAHKNEHVQVINDFVNRLANKKRNEFIKYLFITLYIILKNCEIKNNKSLRESIDNVFKEINLTKEYLIEDSVTISYIISPVLNKSRIDKSLSNYINKNIEEKYSEYKTDIDNILEIKLS